MAKKSLYKASPTATANTVDAIPQDAVRFTTAAAAPKAAPTPDIGVTGTGRPNCEFTARASGNLDNDSVSDEWFISTAAITNVTGAGAVASSKTGSAGEPVNGYNDVSNDT